MKELCESIVTSYNEYRGTGKLLALFLVSVLIICFLKSKDKEGGDRIFSPAWFILCLPGGIGYAFTLLYKQCLLGRDEGSRREKILMRTITGFLIVLTLMLAGNWAFSLKDHYPTENPMHIKQDYVDVMDELLKEQDPVIRVCAPPEFSPYMKAYSARFDVLYAYPRNGDPSYLDGDARYVYEQMSGSIPDQARVVKALRESSVDHIVYDTQKTYFELPFEEYDYELIAERAGYKIYRDKTLKLKQGSSKVPERVWAYITYVSCFGFAAACLVCIIKNRGKEGKVKPDGFALLVIALIACQVIFLYMFSVIAPAALPPGVYGKTGFWILYSLLPLIMIPAYYFAYYRLASCLFKDKRSRWLMLFALCIFNLWGYQSIMLIPVTMLYSYFSLPSVLLHGVCPLVLGLLMERSTVRHEGSDAEISDYYMWEEEDMKNHKIINSRNLAIALFIVVIMLLGSVYIMNRKINNLYQTTVNLQEQVEELKQSE